MIYKYLFLVILFFIGVGTSFSQDDHYKSTLKKMFKVSGTEESYQMVIKQMMKSIKLGKENIPDEFWEELEQELINTTLSDLVDMLAPAYFKYLNIEDLDALIEFYKTPTGKKYAKKTPLIMQESMQIGQEWGRKLGEKIYEKMKEKGY